MTCENSSALHCITQYTTIRCNSIAKWSTLGFKGLVLRNTWYSKVTVPSVQAARHALRSCVLDLNTAQLKVQQCGSQYQDSDFKIQGSGLPRKHTQELVVGRSVSLDTQLRWPNDLAHMLKHNSPTSRMQSTDAVSENSAGQTVLAFAWCDLELIMSD